MKVEITNKQPEGFQPFSINVKFETLEDVVKFLGHMNCSDSEVENGVDTLNLDFKFRNIKGKTGFTWNELGGPIEKHVLKMLK